MQRGMCLECKYGVNNMFVYLQSEPNNVAMFGKLMTVASKWI